MFQTTVGRACTRTLGVGSTCINEALLVSTGSASTVVDIHVGPSWKASNRSSMCLLLSRLREIHSKPDLDLVSCSVFMEETPFLNQQKAGVSDAG